MLNNQLDDLLPDQNIKPSSALNANIHILLHTRIAESLFNGSWKHGKMGLLQFSKVITALWNASRQDDPYADWYLLKTYQTLTESRQQLKLIEDKLALQINNVRGIEISPMINTNPRNFPLTFSTPFGFMGAYLISDVDYVVRQILTLERVGISMQHDGISIKNVVKHVQEAFSTPRRWHQTGVTRGDIVENNDRAQRAKDKLGEVPDSVLHSKISFAFLPKKLKENVHGRNE